MFKKCRGRHQLLKPTAFANVKACPVRWSESPSPVGQETLLQDRHVPRPAVLAVLCRADANSSFQTSSYWFDITFPLFLILFSKF